MSYFFNKATDLPAQTIFPGITGKLVHSGRTTVGDFLIEKGTELPEQHHPHEQISTVLEGEFLFVVGGEERLCRTGEVAVIPPDVPHRGTALTDCRILDVFAPVREDYKVL